MKKREETGQSGLFEIEPEEVLAQVNRALTQRNGLSCLVEGVAAVYVWLSAAYSKHLF